MDHLFIYPKMGSSWLEVLEDPLTRKLLGHHQGFEEDALPFIRGVTTRLDFLIRDPTKHLSFLKIGYSSLEAFLQNNCTGPPLDFNSEDIVIPRFHTIANGSLAQLKKDLFLSLSVDGDAVYALTPSIELFWLAKVCMSNKAVAEAGFNGRRARFRVTFIHQKLLLEKSDTLRDLIYADGDVLEHQLASRLAFHGAAAEEHFVEFLVERAAVRTYYGDDVFAREDLVKAAQTRKFQFALTGVLGKRTKFQDRDISQLVVLARSRDYEPEPHGSRKSSRGEGMDSRKGSGFQSLNSSRVEGVESRKDSEAGGTRSDGEKQLAHSILPTSAPLQPENILLNNDTLLETIYFKQHPTNEAQLSTVEEHSQLPQRLQSLDPANQPLLFPMDSIILLGTASSISNTSPNDGLTREETLPYATRVLDDGSSNWQVYTQALLVRSRIEGYRSRTAERGLLQLQALVDQVNAETGSSSVPNKSEDADGQHSTTFSTFLPKPKAGESASVAERLKYVYQISPPLRWELESELASRWVSMGGLKSALEIYKRLDMPAEVALCLAGTDQGAEAIMTIRKLLFSLSSSDNSESPSYTGPELAPLPSDAPRLFCILGDLESDPQHYIRAWTVSNGRYARAQRSLGRHYVKDKQYKQAADAYTLSLSINRLNASTWFALGCVLLEAQDWPGAVASFTRTVQLEDTDAEAWSNLAIALLRLPELEVPTAEGMSESSGVDIVEVVPTSKTHDDEEETDVTAKGLEDLNLVDEEEEESAMQQPKQYDPYRYTRDALQALRRAAQLKRDDYRIWDNYLTVGASIPPPGTPWSEIIIAQRRVIELRGKTVGEKCVDVAILGVLVEYVVSEYEYPKSEGGGVVKDENESAKPWVGLPRQTCELIDRDVVPLITSSAPLWLIVAKLARWRRRPLAALETHEKAWRAVTSQPGVYESTEERWEGVVEATCGLVGAYMELGGQERERTGGKVVEGDWKFKARTAVRGVMGKGKGLWEATAGWTRLDELMKGLKDGLWGKTTGGVYSNERF